jgi:hypothetical protein
MMLALAAVLPGVFWDGAPDTAPILREAGVRSIHVAPAQANRWKGIEGVTVESADLEGVVKLKTPAVNYRYEQASASRIPWIDGNGWRFLRSPQGRFYYDAAGARASIAAAEAFDWHSAALVKTDADGLKPLAQMLQFLAEVPRQEDWQPIVDLGFIDDDSATAGEVMNLLVRGNLLFRVTRGPDPGAKLTVQLGTKAYPLDKAKNPSMMAQMIRADLTDDRRSLRIYGSAVVVGRLETAAGRMRVHLLNYDSSRTVNGVRVRVAGEYSKNRVWAAGLPDTALLDYAVEPGATEFTVPELKTYVVIDLSR